MRYCFPRPSTRITGTLISISTLQESDHVGKAALGGAEVVGAPKEHDDRHERRNSQLRPVPPVAEENGAKTADPAAERIESEQPPPLPRDDVHWIDDRGEEHPDLH